MNPQAFDSGTTTPRLSKEHGSIDVGVADTLHDKSEPDVESAVETSRKPDDSNKDPNLVDWDGKDDPENPQNYSNLRKWIITLTMSSMTVWITFASSVFSTATLVTAKEFNVSTEVMVLGTSLVVFGFALGPLCWAPLSELYGRRIPLFSGYAIFAIFQIPVAVAQNLETILVCRFLIGVFGCSPLAVVAGAMADIWDPVDRAVAIALFSGATFLGPILGPIVGGFITDSSLGWRWTAWITLIASSFFGLIALLVIPETYGPVILQKRAARLRIETNNWALHSVLDEHKPTMSDIVTKYLFRPLQMLIQEPILVAITLYLALIYGILYLFFEAYPISFGEVRGWTHEGVAALPFIGILVGVVFGICLIIYNTKTRFARKLAKHGKVVPEERLVPMMVASVLLPIGLFWFGWTSNPNISWVPQAIAGVPIGVGILVIFMQGLNYLIDVYMMFANSAVAANTLIRSIVGGAFPLFATQMYRNLGVAWASSVLGFITLAMIPIPILFFIYGARIRAMSKFSPKF
ncbi:Major facilitator superfamily domain general substrate transporter [Penicillium cf. griseofulvum]|uniref:Major facilitator superfamily domain general substrate transporter n=1 Tax=Penicillium cf. griseofulvum TaxID=2972120 RepID=A0A9W9MEV7_9EURO|nr:Major facilitator superfamily domain general substrate transporter [Penicillium cf. griseofulvum]KAJ5423387.1 Major facilitator superfamily domain general substrate transporter [Penicillium cf. griseofulvum]KAJ5431344.1 Major facilitator superfamily domain general substrate transporter [Penicillium cf. griseofulvum]